MRSLGTRRVAQAAGAAMVAVIALAGCSAGQVAETAILKAPVSGLNTQSPDGGLQIRNLQVLYNGTEGYEEGGSAPLEVSLFNHTEQPITVMISGGRPASADAHVLLAQSVGVGKLSTGEPSAAATTTTPDPSSSASAPASAEPSTPALQPARFTIEPLGSKVFLGTESDALQAQGLSGQLRPGFSLALTIEVSTSNQPLQVVAPFAIPTSPASRAPGLEDENHEG
jgi:hypothetical protein